MKGKLDNKVVIITGALGLLGREFSKAIVEAGGLVILADINKENGKKLETDLNNMYGGEVAHFCYMDITKKKYIDKTIHATLKRHGKIDALVNNAYPRNKNYGRKFEDVDYKDFCENVNLHLGGFFLVSQCLSSFFKKQGYGNIINIASVYGVIAPRFEIYEGTNMTMPVEYAVIKSSIIHLTRYLAKYLRNYNIRVNTISPGGILDKQPDSFIKKYKKYCLTKGMLEKKDINGLLIFLLSDDSKYINGQNIIIDDGFSL